MKNIQKEKGFIIYALTDPRNNEVRYVGCTQNVLYRRNNHFKHPCEHKKAWIAELERMDMIPLIQKIDFSNDWDEALRKESYWINFYIGKGCNLLNRIGYSPDMKKYLFRNHKGLRKEFINNSLESATQTAKEIFQTPKVYFIKVVEMKGNLIEKNK